MKERIIELLLKYAEAKKTAINEFSGNIHADLLNLHNELWDYCSDVFDNVGRDSEGINYWKDIYPLLPDCIKEAYEDEYRD